MKNLLGFGGYQPDTTQRADRQVDAFNEPQALVPGIHGSLTPLSLRSNRTDRHSQLMATVSNLITFPPTLSSLISDLLLWASVSGTLYLVVKLAIPFMPYWFPYVSLGVPIATFLCIGVSVILHRPKLTLFFLLRLLLIATGLTIVW